MKRSAATQAVGASSGKKSKPNQPQPANKTKQVVPSPHSQGQKKQLTKTQGKPEKVILTQNAAQNDVFALGSFDDSESELDEPTPTSTPADPNSLVSLGGDDHDDGVRNIRRQIAQMNKLHKSDQKDIEAAVKRHNIANPNSIQLPDYQDNAAVAEEEDDGEELPLPPPTNPDCFNPFLDAYYVWLKQSPADIERLFDPTLSDDRRRLLIDHLPTKSQRQYAWAIPTTESIQVLYHFSPVIEIGAGKGYWGGLLRKFAQKQFEATGQCKTKDPMDVYAGFDCQPAPEKGQDIHLLNLEYKKQQQEDRQTGFAPTKGQNIKKGQVQEPMRYIKDIEHPSWTKILVGDSNELKRSLYKNHTLFLCYPDDFEFSERSLAFDCLRKFSGQYIITVGEWLGETRQENPWGRSADSQFQQHLCDQFHKIAQIPLPSFHSSCDHLCVWKRTVKCVIDRTDDDDGIVFRYVPSVEKLSIRSFAPCLQDLNDLLQDEPTFIDDGVKLKAGDLHQGGEDDTTMNDVDDKDLEVLSDGLDTDEEGAPQLIEVKPTKIQQTLPVLSVYNPKQSIPKQSTKAQQEQQQGQPKRKLIKPTSGGKPTPKAAKK